MSRFRSKSAILSCRAANLWARDLGFDDRRSSTADHLKIDLYVPAHRVRVGANLGMSFLDELLELGLRHTLIVNTQLDGQTKAATLARTDRNRTGHLGLACILLVLLGDKVEGTAKA